VRKIFSSSLEIGDYKSPSVWKGLASAVCSDLDDVCLGAFGMKINPHFFGDGKSEWEINLGNFSARGKTRTIVGNTHVISESQNNFSINNEVCLVDNGVVVENGIRFQYSAVSY